MSQPNEASSSNNSLQVPNKEPSSQHDVSMLDIPMTESAPKKEKTMGEFLAMMDNYAPIVNATMTVLLSGLLTI